jgi:hypothetical protein
VSSSLDALSERWPHLAATFRRHWQTPLPEYARLLWADPPTGTIDPLLARALRAESLRVTGSEEAAEVVLRRRVAPTAHHVTPTNGPGFLAADWIASAADAQPVTVLAWSGVSLSNTAWSGCLSFTTNLLLPGSPTARRAARSRADRSRDAGTTEERLWLFPAKLRDALLYRIPCHPRLTEVLADLRPEVAQHLSTPGDEDDFPTWALRTCATVQRAVVRRPLHYLDLCRILADYLAAAMEDDAHPLAALMRSPEAMASRFPETSWLYARHGHKVAVLRPDADGKGFSGRGVTVASEAVAEGLREGTLCPGLLPGFVALACLNPIRCLGSFNQARYLSEIRAAWGAVADEGPSLIAGRVAGEVYPLDRLSSGQPLPATAEIRMGSVWAGLLR